MTEVFLDSSYAIALSSAKDTHHLKALDFAQKFQSAPARIVTTEPILFEIGNALSQMRHRQAAVNLIESIEQDTHIEVVVCSQDLFRRAVDLFQSRYDKDWGLTDCFSFVVMEDRGITDALTADHHFQQAGYRALLLEHD